MSLPRWRHAAGTGAIGHPHVTLGIDENAVRRDHQACTETLDQLSSLIEMQDRIEHGIRTRVGAAALSDPDRFAVAVDLDRAGRSPRAAGRHPGPVLHRAIR